MQRTPRLRELRERAALSQEDVAERSGVARATIADLEAGKRPARPSTIRKLAKGLGVEVTELYAEPESPKVPAPPSSQEKLFNNGLFEEERREDINNVALEAARRQLKQDIQAANRALESGRVQAYFMRHENDARTRLLQHTADELAGALMDLARRYVELEQEKEQQNAAFLKQLEELAGRA